MDPSKVLNFKINQSSHRYENRFSIYCVE